VALHLATLMDDGKLMLEGLVPHGSKNKYKMPVKLFVYARNDAMTAVKKGVSRAYLTLETGVAAEHTLEVCGGLTSRNGPVEMCCPCTSCDCV
jgi:hypothetical protein